MSDDLLSALGRVQREDLEEPSAVADDALSRPFDADEREDILAGVFGRLDASEAEPEPEGEGQTQVEEPSEPQRKDTKVVALVRRSRVALVSSVLAVAAAAALVWWVAPSGRESGTVATVPVYTFTQLRGGIAGTRSDPSAPSGEALPELELRHDSSIDWVLTPEQPTGEPVGVALFARSAAGEVAFVPRLGVELSERGAVRIKGPLNRFVMLAPGTWTVTLLLAAADQLPNDAERAGEGSAAWRSLMVRVIIVAD
jgi:hypothetical protein